MLWTRLQMDVRETLLPDVMALELRMFAVMYMRSANLRSNLLCKNLAWWVVTWKTSINHRSVKIGGWAHAWGWVLARDNMVLYMNSLPVHKL